MQEERDSFSKHLIGGGFTDVWRHRHPDVVGYTYFSYKLKDRQDSKGWRLDYFLVCLTEPVHTMLLYSACCALNHLVPQATFHNVDMREVTALQTFCRQFHCTPPC